MFTAIINRGISQWVEDDETPGRYNQETEWRRQRSLILPDEAEDGINEGCIPDDPENPVTLKIIKWETHYEVIQFFDPWDQLKFFKIECYKCGSKHFRALVRREYTGILQCVSCDEIVPGITVIVR